jgi:hypothetical protein
MKKSVLLLAIVVALFATSCVSNFKATADYDKSTDFSVYKTFQMLDWNPHNSSHVEASTAAKLQAAAQNEMENLGYTLVQSNGDLAVGLSVLIEEKVEYRSDGSVNYNVGYGYYGYGGYGMGYSGPTTYRSYYYNEGTIIVDIFDEKKKMMVWQGYGFDRLEDNAHKNVQKIDTYMKYIFHKYPGKVKSK